MVLTGRPARGSTAVRGAKGPTSYLERPDTGYEAAVRIGISGNISHLQRERGAVRGAPGVAT